MKNLTTYTTRVEGKPIPEGSMKAFPYRKKSGGMGVSMIHNKQTELFGWRDSIKQSFLIKYPEIEREIPFPKGTPVIINIEIMLVRPKSNKNKYPCGKVGDVDKQARSVLDACTELLYYDDCQVVSLNIIKKYGECMGATISVSDEINMVSSVQ